MLEFYTVLFMVILMFAFMFLNRRKLNRKRKVSELRNLGVTKTKADFLINSKLY